MHIQFLAESVTMIINEKVFTQLLETVNAASREPVATVLAFLYWWRLQEQGTLDDSQTMQRFVGRSTTDTVDALKGMLERVAYAAVDSGWDRVESLPTLNALVEKICLFGAQGLLQDLHFDDAYYWAPSASPSLALAPTLAELLVSLLELRPGQQVYAPWDVTGQLSTRLLRSDTAPTTETAATSAVASLIALVEAGKSTVHATDPILSPAAVKAGQLIQFDAAVAAPPMGLRYPTTAVESDLFNRFPEKTSTGSILQIRHLIAHTQGRIVVVVPNSVLFSVGAERTLRKELVERQLIEAVIALPSGLFAGSTTSAAILILNSASPSEQVRFVNADAPAFRAIDSRKRTTLTHLPALLDLINDTSPSPQATSVNSETLSGQDFSLEVGRYVVEDSVRELEKTLASFQTIKLSEGFEIIRARQHATTTTGVAVREVLAADVPDFAYIPSASKEALFDLGSPKATSYFLKPYDIVLAIKGSVGKVGMVQTVPAPGEGGWLVGQSFVVLRALAQGPCTPHVLLTYLRSAAGQSALSRLMVGATMPTLQLASLKELSIPVPDELDAEKMRDAVDAEARLQATIEELKHEQAALSSGFWR